MSCGVGRRLASDPKLLWVWHRLAATAPIRRLAWEPPYVTGVALKRQKTKKKKKNDMESKLIQWKYFQDLKSMNVGGSHHAQQKQISLVSMRMQVRSLASLSRLKIWHCHDLWCTSQTRLRSDVAVAVV